jgi:hypothetical protein
LVGEHKTKNLFDRLMSEQERKPLLRKPVHAEDEKAKLYGGGNPSTDKYLDGFDDVVDRF